MIKQNNEKKSKSKEKVHERKKSKDERNKIMNDLQLSSHDRPIHSLFFPLLFSYQLQEAQLMK